MSNAIPVLLMNPDTESTPMARRRTRRTRKATTATHRRRHRNPANPRRRTRRHRNPKIDMKGLALAGLGGLGVAGAEFALDGVTSITNGYQALILAGIGIVGGGLLSMWSPPIGLGVLATGFGIGAYKGGTMLLSAPSTGAKKSTAPAQLQGTVADLRAIRAELGAVRAMLPQPQARGSYTTDAFVQAELAGIGR
jgi:hypothetical protein